MWALILCWTCPPSSCSCACSLHWYSVLHLQLNQIQQQQLQQQEQKQTHLLAADGGADGRTRLKVEEVRWVLRWVLEAAELEQDRKRHSYLLRNEVCFCGCGWLVSESTMYLNWLKETLCNGVKHGSGRNSIILAYNVNYHFNHNLCKRK